MTRKDELIGIVNKYVIDSPTPSNISYMWNFESLLGLMLVWQMITVLTGVSYTSYACSEYYYGPYKKKKWWEEE